MKETGGSGTSQTSPGGSKASLNTNWFTLEIQQMMYGFGDCRRPLHDTAVVIEDIVHQQMASLLQQASDVASSRSSRFIGLEDFLFMLRKDKVKLHRLLKYMQVKDLKAATLKGAGLDEDEPTEQGDSKVQPVKKRRKICYDFLASIDPTGELLALFDDSTVDEIKYDRLMRAEVQTRGMDPQQYLEFCEARQAGFNRKYKSQRFKDWLMAGVTIDIKPNAQALEVISYLAYETVAQIVDLALIVKQDMKASMADPMMQHYPNTCLNYHDALPTTAMIGTSKSSLAGMSSPTKQSPPSTPTTPATQGPAGSSGGAGLSGSTQGFSGSSSSSSKSKSKKRKKSGPANMMEMSGSQAIQPSDVREAMRRFGHCIGPFASTTKVNHQFPPRKRLLCT